MDRKIYGEGGTADVFIHEGGVNTPIVILGVNGKIVYAHRHCIPKK